MPPLINQFESNVPPENSKRLICVILFVKSPNVPPEIGFDSNVPPLNNEFESNVPPHNVKCAEAKFE